MKILYDPDDMIKTSREWRLSGKSIAFVPTMGALHAGHVSLVKRARELADKTVVSIFVNPLQFAQGEDFSRYPRTMEEDLRLLSLTEVDAVFSPQHEKMYSRNFQTSVANTRIKDILCGKTRKGHFDGVCTVVLKLFNIVRPDFALFGKKDYQQLSIIKHLNDDLHLGICIHAGETVRESDGLAMSSRNRYLSDHERREAAALSAGLFAAKANFDRGERSVLEIKESFYERLKKDVSVTSPLSVEYLEIRDALNLEREMVSIVDSDAVMLLAAKFPSVRLIDNVELIAGA